MDTRLSIRLFMCEDMDVSTQIEFVLSRQQQGNTDEWSDLVQDVEEERSRERNRLDERRRERDGS